MKKSIEGWIKINILLLIAYVALNLIRDYMGMSLLPCAYEATISVFAVLLYGIIPLFIYRKGKFILSLISFHMSYKNENSRIISTQK